MFLLFKHKKRRQESADAILRKIIARKEISIKAYQRSLVLPFSRSTIRVNESVFIFQILITRINRTTFFHLGINLVLASTATDFQLIR